MTRRQFQATILVFAEDLTYREAGERMGISARSAERLVARGLRRVRQHRSRAESAQALEADDKVAA